MRIAINNYKTFIVAFEKGLLTEKEELCLLEFLEQNDLLDELEMPSTLIPQAAVIDKTTLLKEEKDQDELEISLAKLAEENDSNSILFTEAPHLVERVDQYRQIRLQPGEVTFPHKVSLIKRRKVIPLYAWVSSAAAVIVIALMFFFQPVVETNPFGNSLTEVTGPPLSPLVINTADTSTAQAPSIIKEKVAPFTKAAIASKASPRVPMNVESDMMAEANVPAIDTPPIDSTTASAEAQAISATVPGTLETVVREPAFIPNNAIGDALSKEEMKSLAIQSAKKFVRSFLKKRDILRQDSNGEAFVALGKVEFRKVSE